jgi:hypothetical protein
MNQTASFSGGHVTDEPAYHGDSSFAVLYPTDRNQTPKYELSQAVTQAARLLTNHNGEARRWYET